MEPTTTVTVEEDGATVIRAGLSGNDDVILWLDTPRGRRTGMTIRQGLGVGVHSVIFAITPELRAALRSLVRVWDQEET